MRKQPYRIMSVFADTCELVHYKGDKPLRYRFRALDLPTVSFIAKDGFEPFVAMRIKAKHDADSSFVPNNLEQQIENHKERDEFALVGIRQGEDVRSATIDLETHEVMVQHGNG